MTQIIGSSLIVDDRPGRAWGWFVGVGVVLAMLGALASANLMFATLAATITVGVMMFAGGVFQLVHAFGVRRQGRTWWWALSGLLYMGAALVTLADPLFAAGVLTLLLAASLAASGLVRAYVAFAMRERGWGWLLLSGLVSIGVALVLALGWPWNTIWVLGVVLAVDLFLQGFMLLLAGFALRAVRL